LPIVSLLPHPWIAIVATSESSDDYYTILEREMSCSKKPTTNNTAPTARERCMTLHPLEVTRVKTLFAHVLRIEVGGVVVDKLAR
jgi:hypothetical protein